MSLSFAAIPALGLIDSPVHLDAEAWVLAVVIGTFLAGVHAYRKLEPYFAITWFGAGLVFGWFWTDARSPEALLLPALVIYLAAALTKGLVERGAFAGNHVVHVLATGVFAAFVALPLESAARAMSWTVPRTSAPAVTRGVVREQWLGGVSADVLVQWSMVAVLFYGLYKTLDHIGLGPVLQTVLLFLGAPFLVPLADSLLKLML